MSPTTISNARMLPCLALLFSGAAWAQPPESPGRSVDPRVEQRTYLFEETGEELPYAVFVSSGVDRDEASPLVVALHGLGGDQNSLVRQVHRTVDFAEDGGYILVAPMGYNSGGWYGIPPRPDAGAGRGRVARAPRAGGTAVTDVARVRELSEQDVMNVLAMMQEEFNVDPDRIYLMGHSMGGRRGPLPRRQTRVDLGRARADRAGRVQARSRFAGVDPGHADHHRPGRRGYRRAGREHATLGGETRRVGHAARVLGDRGRRPWRHHRDRDAEHLRVL